MCIHYFIKETGQQSKQFTYICSTRYGNLRNLQIVLHNLENPQIACQSADCVHKPRNLGIAHEFRFHAHAASHARAASSSDVSVFATMSTSAEE